jgi:hypothetical protein
MEYSQTSEFICSSIVKVAYVTCEQNGNAVLCCVSRSIIGISMRLPVMEPIMAPRPRIKTNVDFKPHDYEEIERLAERNDLKVATWVRQIVLAHVAEVARKDAAKARRQAAVA